MTKNLFDYATKELSQDAFLMWLFESWKDEEISPCVYALARKFCGLENDEKIKHIETYAQWRNIDITVKIETNKNNIFALFIEDKVFSNEHNQLLKYNTEINSILQWAKKEEGEDWMPRRVFYKTSELSDTDKSAIKDSIWEKFDIVDICSLFSPFANTNNAILKQYIEHIFSIYTAMNNTQKPTENRTKIDLLKWEAYFHKIGDEIVEKGGYTQGGVWKAGRFPYMCIVFRKDRYAPYLEIRSKDCLNNRFEAVILCYGIAEKDDNEKPFTAEEVKIYQSILLKKIQDDNFFSTKGVLHNPNGYNKQLGRYVSEKEIISDEDFLSELEKCAAYYNELMAFWNIITKYPAI